MAVGKNEPKEVVMRDVAESDKPIIGTVLKAWYERVLSQVPKQYSGGPFVSCVSNETVKLDSKYTLRVETDEGRVLGISVIDFCDHTKESLAILIDSAEEVGLEKATKVSFPQGNLHHWRYVDHLLFRGKREIHQSRDYEETYFQAYTQFGTKRADRIRILDGR